MKSTRHTLLVVITMAVVIGALGLTFYYKGNLQGMKTAVQTAHWGYAPLAILAGLLVYPVKAWRWQILIGPGQPVRYRSLLSAVMIGFMANCIVSRLGELIRAAVISLKGEMRTSAALASIALERIFDMLTVALFLILALRWLQPAAVAEGDASRIRTMLSHAQLPLAVALGAGILFLALLRVYPQGMTALLARCTRLLPRRIRGKVEGFLATFLGGLDTLRSWTQVAAVLVLSLVHWGLQVAFFLLAAYCFPDMPHTVPVALLIFAVVAFGVAGLPLPGYIGIYQLAVLGAGAVIGMPTQPQKDAWTSYSWLSWALNIPFVILVGFIFLWKEKLSFSQIRKETGERPATEGAPAAK